MCCGKSITFDFGKVVDSFSELRNVGKKDWPVLYNEQEPLIMVHSSVGTQSIFNNGQCKVIISGFCTSLGACSSYLQDVITDKNEEESEVKHTFGGGTQLRRNLEKILLKVGLYEKLGLNESRKIKDYSWEMIKAVKKDSKKYPILMTQALCCIGTTGGSEAGKIISSILSDNLPDEFRRWVDNSLTEWVNRIMSKKSEDAILLLLGHVNDPKRRQSAIVRLLKKARINKGYVSTNLNCGITLYDYLSREFDGRMSFLIHPANLNDKNLSTYLNSEEGKKVKNLIEELVLY